MGTQAGLYLRGTPPPPLCYSWGGGGGGGYIPEPHDSAPPLFLIPQIPPSAKFLYTALTRQNMGHRGHMGRGVGQRTGESW